MMKKAVFLFILTCSTIKLLHAQEIFVQAGKNLSSYEFVDLGNELPTLTPEVGTTFKIGYSTVKSDGAPFFYSFGVSVNEYNAKGYYNTIDLNYRTNYLGLFGAINFSVYNSQFNNIAISAGLSSQSLVHGNQTIDGKNNDLMKEKEFTGFVLGPQIGLKYQYVINSDVNLLLEYSYSRHWNLSNQGTQKLTIQNHGIHFGLSVNIY